MSQTVAPSRSNTEQIKKGESGLFYLTDSADRSIFIAAPSPFEAREFAKIARAVLRRGGVIPNHTLHDHVNGGQVVVPNPEDMTSEQCIETVLLLQRHLMMKFEI